MPEREPFSDCCGAPVFTSREDSSVSPRCGGSYIEVIRCSECHEICEPVCPYCGDVNGCSCPAGDIEEPKPECRGLIRAGRIVVAQGEKRE